MGNCSFCNGVVNWRYKCKYCGNKFCPEHRIPENHECSFALNQEKEPEKKTLKQEIPIESHKKLYQYEAEPNENSSDFLDFITEEGMIQDEYSTINFEDQLELFFPGTKDAVDQFQKTLSEITNIKLKNRMSLSKFSKIFTYIAPNTRENHKSRRFRYLTRSFSVKTLVESGMGNCLAYTTLIIILAKRFGLEMRAADVIIPYRTKYLIEEIGHVCAVDNNNRNWDAVNFNGKNYIQHKKIKILNDRQFLSLILSMEVNRLSKDKNIDNRIHIAKTAVFLDRNSEPALINLGNEYSAQRKFNHAEQCYNKALELNPQKATSWMNLAGIYRAQKKINKSEYAFKEVLKIMPHHLVAHLRLGDLYMLNNSYEKALKILGEATEIAGDARKYREQLKILTSMARIYQTMGKHEDALKKLNWAVKNCEYTSYHLGKAESLDYIGQIHEEVGDYKKAIENYKKSYAIYEKRGHPRTNDIRRKIDRLSFL